MGPRQREGDCGPCVPCSPTELLSLSASRRSAAAEVGETGPAAGGGSRQAAHCQLLLGLASIPTAPSNPTQILHSDWSVRGKYKCLIGRDRLLHCQLVPGLSHRKCTFYTSAMQPESCTNFTNRYVRGALRSLCFMSPISSNVSQYSEYLFAEFEQALH